MVRRYAHLSANHLLKVSATLEGMIGRDLPRAFTFSSRLLPEADSKRGLPNAQTLEN